MHALLNRRGHGWESRVGMGVVCIPTLLQQAAESRNSAITLMCRNPDTDISRRRLGSNRRVEPRDRHR